MSRWSPAALLKTWTMVRLTVLTTGATAVAVLFLADANFPGWYSRTLRSDFFNSSLTVAGFLLSVATFIVTAMKDGVYDKEAYRKTVEIANKVNAIQESPYAPLRRLTQLLVIAVAACLLCAAIHVVFGFTKQYWAAAICASSAATASTLVGFGVLAAYQNFLDWLKHAEDSQAKADPPSR